ncbi:hypothetical protein [Streptomyces avidinii]|uniref:HNH endonuclease n=1 Tax=Streptomyces avidinii TaxID=1895 RepID=A0ABS4KXW2_STRAV|nr:hypothetical protein [Streptomyces avidinii]
MPSTQRILAPLLDAPGIAPGFQSDTFGGQRLLAYGMGCFLHSPSRNSFYLSLNFLTSAHVIPINVLRYAYVRTNGSQTIHANPVPKFRTP